MRSLCAVVHQWSSKALRCADMLFEAGKAQSHDGLGTEHQTHVQERHLALRSQCYLFGTRGYRACVCDRSGACRADLLRRCLGDLQVARVVGFSIADHASFDAASQTGTTRKLVDIFESDPAPNSV